ncbi:MAG TPA: hypothetical protein VNA17_05215 [Pyrinomonadaceae bacterium]|nr:hypothetical protein [Pyrinomonadaceae bacterium]
MTTGTDFPTAYMRLRTLLDALQVNVMRYCLDETKDPEESVARMEGLDEELMSVIEHVGGGAPCDAGYYNCGGVCVPYQCFEAYLQTSEQAPPTASTE